MEPSEVWCTPAEAAPVVGVHRTTVMRQARAWGMLRADGRLNLSHYQARRERELNPLMVREAAPATAAAAPDNSVASAAAELKQRQAALLQLRLDRESGRQLDAGEVQSAVGEAGGLLRSLLGALPARLAVELARESDPDAIERRLAGAHDQILRDFDAALTEAAQAGDEEEELEEA